MTGARLTIETRRESVAAAPAFEDLLAALDGRRGLLMDCRTTYPGRYRPQWQGFVDPALQVVCRGGAVRVEALAPAGLAPLRVAAEALDLEPADGAATAELAPLGGFFGLLRRLMEAFGRDDAPELGFFCALGYDLALDRYGIERRQPRHADQKDAVLYLPQSLLLCRDPASGTAERLDFAFGLATGALPEPPPAWPAIRPWREPPRPEEPAPGHYRAVVERARDACRAGTLFEVVAGQSFRRRSPHAPSALYRRLAAINPSPYGFLANLDGEHLVGCSPEIFLRVADGLVESAPISGTVRRGRDAVEDAERTLGLLASAKAEAELTMCSDVDRNDKAAVCLPGTVELIGRRQIETYSHVVHTVDHVRGRLRPECDAVDALAAHLWSVTLTGAPRPAALAFIEANENAPRRWYGGAVGRLGLDGTLDSGIVLRALQLVGDLAEVRVGASLLHASDPEDEERETLVKAEAMFRALEPEPPAGAAPAPAARGTARRVALHDLGGPFPELLRLLLREGGHAVVPPGDAAEAALVTCGVDAESQAAAAVLVQELMDRGVPLLAIGHAMLALGEVLGGRSRPEAEPRQGARLTVAWSHPRLAELLPPGAGVGCYHRARLDAALPPGLRVLARAHDGEVLAVESADGRACGLLFHPESLLTRDGPALLERLLATD